MTIKEYNSNIMIWVPTTEGEEDMLFQFSADDMHDFTKDENMNGIIAEIRDSLPITPEIEQEIRDKVKIWVSDKSAST